ncbi:MAG: hypothetical protein ABL963_07855 [Longimicrobiales bacterium]
MSLMLDRRPRSTRYLAWKIRIFALAAVVAVVGMYLDNPYVTGTALVLLFIGMLLRLLPEPKEPTGPEGPPRA